MRWNVEMTDEFEKCLESLTVAERNSVLVSIRLLEEAGPLLPRPHSDTLKGSKFGNMKELRTQHAGKPFRSIYAFDPNRTAILLIGGCKAGDNRWYKKYIPIADKLYQEHLDS